MKKYSGLLILLMLMSSLRLSAFATMSKESTENYFMNQEYDYYTSGVYKGMVKFTDKGVEFSPVDPQTRVQLKRDILNEEPEGMQIPLLSLYKELDVYANTKWDKEQVTTSHNKKFNKYMVYKGIMNGEEKTGQLWARRELYRERNMDLVTVDNEIVAFIATGRVSMDILVKRGYNNVTPMTKYDDPLLSKVEHGVRPLGNTYITMTDGVKLATEIFLPSNLKEGEKVPTILIRTPYGKTGQAAKVSHWVNRGYALVAQDVRGVQDSEGDLVAYQHEKDDANDTINWIAAQEWSNGNVGMTGASYVGYTATAGATTGNPHLKTVITDVAVGSPFRDMSRKNGTIRSWPSISWILAQSNTNRFDRMIFSGQSVNPEEVCSTKPIGDIPSLFINKEAPTWSAWTSHYYYDDFWKKSDNTVNGSAIKIPMLIISGWYDDDNSGTQELWKILKDNNVEGARMVLGPWPHNSNQWRACRDIEFGDNAIDYDYDTRFIRWFDKYLKGIENGEDKKAEVTYYLVGENEWKTSDDWNPTESKLTNLYFDGESKTSTINGNHASTRLPINSDFKSYVYDPANPIISEPSVELYDCSSIQKREDVIVFDTNTLKNDVAVAGDIAAEFYAASSAPDTDFIVRISDVDENGIARRVSDGVVRAEFRNGFDNPMLLEANKIEKYEILMNFNGHVFKKGHKIRVDISSSSLLEYIPNTNTGINPYENPEPIIATQKIYYGGQYPSHIKLPVLYGDF